MTASRALSRRRWRFGEEKAAELLKKKEERVKHGAIKLSAAEKQRWYRYKIAPPEFAARLKEQGNACACCHRMFDTVRTPVVDHDHACCPKPPTCGKCTRSLLCSACNKALGLLEASDLLLSTLFDYIKRFA